MVLWHDGEVSGPRFDDGSCEADKNYSLIINNVSTADAWGIYCTVSNYKGILIENYTDISITAQPLKPFPTIQECLNTGQYDSNYCTLVAESGMTLTCEAMKYHPAVNLLFLHGSRIVDPLDTREWNNTDGTKNKTLTIAASGSKELYTCVASNIPGTSDNESISVLLHDEGSIKSAVPVIILILFAALILISLVAFFIWRKKHHVDVKNLSQEKVQSLEQHVDGVFMKHYRRIYDAMETKSFQAEKIISENRTALFDTHRMLNSQYRMVVKEASIVSNKSDAALGHTWPSIEELKSISRHLTQESMTKICQKLTIDCNSNDTNDEGKRSDSLREWRNKVAEKHLEEKHEQLSSALGSNRMKGLLPPLKGQFIYKAELVDMAFHMLMQDFLPIAGALGIHYTKMITYRPAFEPFYLQIGNIDLLSKLLIKVKVDVFGGDEKRDTRSLFCTKLSKLQYHNVATLGICVYEMSFGELFRIAEAMTQNTGEGSAVKDKQEGASQFDEAAAALKTGTREEAYSLVAPSTLPQGEDREEPDSEMAEIVPGQLEVPKNKHSKRELSIELFNLQRVLRLPDEDIANCLDLKPSDPITAYTLLKLWKKKPRQSVFNYRAALPHELRTMKMPGLADEVIASRHIHHQTDKSHIH